MNGYIIEKYNNMNNAYTSRRYMEEAKKQDIKLDIIGAHDTYLINNKLYNANDEVKKRDFSIVRFKDGHIRDGIGKMSNYHFNKIEHINSYGDKYVQLKNISSKNMINPKFILGFLGIDYEFVTEKIGKPFVIKTLKDSQGKGVYLINNYNEYTKICGEFKNINKEFIFEEFIKESFGKDIRVFSIQGEVLACVKRKSKCGFKANFALGGDVEIYPLDDDIKKITQDIYNITSMYYTGIDLLLGKDGYVFCEVNITPGIEGVEKVSGCNVARELIYSIKNTINNEKV
jgi:ribosomal protein S6--L-glutamate ligase